MKKRFLMKLVAGLFMIGMVGGANATLIQVTSDGKNMIYDDATSYYWQSAIDRFSYLTYENVLAAVVVDNSNLYGAVNTWELASKSQVNTLFSSITDQNINLFHQTARWPGMMGSPDVTVWNGRTSTKTGGFHEAHNYKGYVIPDNSLGYNINGAYPDDNGGLTTGAWVMSTSAPAPVPEPSTLAIFALGIISLASRRFKK